MPLSFRSRSASLPLYALLLLLLVEALALANALPRMRDAIWQDEAATLLDFATSGWARTLLDYHSPNNHMLFSTMLAGWMPLWPDGVDTFRLRLLPLLTYLVALPVTMLAARRIGGAGCAAAAGLLFALSTVAANFATQLRGYAPSWLFVSAALWCALNANEAARLRWRPGYVVACMVSVGLLPSNLLLVLVIGIACSLRLLVLHGWRAPGARGAVVLLLLGPFLGLLVYVPVFGSLIANAQIDFSSWNRVDLARAWLQGTLLDFLFLVPLFAAGLALGAQDALRHWRDGRRDEASQFVLVAALLCGLGGVLLVMPNTPFPRTLVPYLPAWLCALGWCLSRCVTAATQRDRRLPAAFVACLAAAVLWSARPLPECRGAKSAIGSGEYDLCYQYFRDRYRPDLVAEAWVRLGRPDVPIAGDYEATYALTVLGLQVHEYRSFPQNTLAPAPMVVAHEPARVPEMLGHLGVGSTRYRLLVDTGYFKVYGAEDYGAPPRR